MKKLTRQQFIDQYTDGNLGHYQMLLDHGRHAIPCSCGDALCQGWAMGRSEDVEKYLKEVTES